MVCVYAIGRALIDVGGASVKPASARKFPLLLRLAAQPGHRVSRAALWELIYPDLRRASAMHSLREMAYTLRRSGIGINADDRGIALAADDVWLDYSALLAGEPPSAEQLRALEGGFLPGYAPSHSEAFSEWLEGFRAQSTSALSRTLVAAAAHAKLAGDTLLTARIARTCLALDPLNEEATFFLAETLALGGAKVQAVKLLNDYLAELRGGSAELRVPAEVLKHRIGERLFERYVAPKARAFVGREDEMRILMSGLAEVRRGGVRCVAVTGEPGMGKTRLAAEFAARCSLEGCCVARVSARPIDREHPMAAFVDLVPQLLALPGALGCSPASMGLLNRLTRHDPAPPPGDGAQTPDASGSVAARIAGAIEDVIDAIAGEAPLVVIVDDAQWLDDVSRYMIRHLATRGDSQHLMLVVTARPDASRAPIGTSDGQITAVAIAPLAATACARLLAEVFPGADDGDESLRVWMAEASGGNPFILECLIAHFQSTGERFVVPPQIDSLVDQRLALLSARGGELLHAAVALGKHATIERLIEVMDLPTMSLVQAIRELETARLISSGAVVEAAHWLIGEAVIRQQTPLAMKVLHRKIAPILQQEATQSHDAALLWACAEHWALSDDPYHASDAFKVCAEYAVEIGRSRESAELLLRSAAFAAPSKRPSLLEAAIRTAFAAAEMDLVLRAADLLGETGHRGRHDDVEIAVLAARMFADHHVVGDVLASLQTCACHDEATGAHRLEATMILLMWCDQNRDADLVASVLKSLRGPLHEARADDSLLALKCLLVYHSCFGDPATGAEVARQVLAVAATTRGDIAADLFRKAAVALWRTGEADAAIAAYERSFTAAEDYGLHRLQFVVALMLAANMADLGHHGRVQTWLARAEHLRGTITGREIDFLYATIRSDIALGSGDDARLVATTDTLGDSNFHLDRRGRRWRSAMTLYTRHVRGHDIDWAVEESRLREVQAVGLETGEIGDFETAVLAIALAKSGRHERARGVMDQYLGHYRRGRTPLSAGFQRAMRELAYTDHPRWADADR